MALETAANLPSGEENADLPEASDPADQKAQAAGYRLQASTLAASLHIGGDELEKRFAAERQRIDGERKSRQPDDFAEWITGEADGCPAI